MSWHEWLEQCVTPQPVPSHHCSVQLLKPYHNITLNLWSDNLAQGQKAATAVARETAAVVSPRHRGRDVPMVVPKRHLLFVVTDYSSPTTGWQQQAISTEERNSPINTHKQKMNLRFIFAYTKKQSTSR